MGLDTQHFSQAPRRAVAAEQEPPVLISKQPGGDAQGCLASGLTQGGGPSEDGRPRHR